MATYVYETIPEKPGEEVRRFEVRQSMRDEPLTRDPESGRPVKRVILGGFGIMSKGAAAPQPLGCGGGECAMPAPGAHACTSPFCCQN